LLSLEVNKYTIFIFWVNTRSIIIGMKICINNNKQAINRIFSMVI
jgi:hypothetical protein